MSPHQLPPAIPRAWPVLAALGLVVLLVIAMLGADLLVARRVADRTTAIVENSQRSVELVDDLRAQAHRLADHSRTPEELRRTVARISADAKAYDPLTTSAGEHDEWIKLQDLLGQLEAGAPVANEVGRSIDRLVTINGLAAHTHAVEIRDAHRKAIIADAAAGGLTLALVSVIAMIILRMLARQRTLTAQHIALLDEKNRDLEAFAGRAAHDLRGPLNPIRGYADLLREGPSAAEVSDMAKHIRVAVDRMARVVDEMLALSVSGRPLPGVCAPDQVVTEVLEEMGPELRGTEVATEVLPEPVGCSAGVLSQILRNLIGNAVKFRSRHRPLALKLGTRVTGPLLELIIEDNGVGMDAESASHAFEAYYRGRADRELPGHGLGLAIVERTTRALGGSCELSSVPDQGTRIVVRLPRTPPLPA